jgi:hypothetical protein
LLGNEGRVLAILQVAKAVGTKDAAACEALYHRFQTYLSLPKGIQHEVAFLAMVRDMHNHVTKVRACPRGQTLQETAASLGPAVCSIVRARARACRFPERHEGVLAAGGRER